MKTRLPYLVFVLATFFFAVQVNAQKNDEIIAHNKKVYHLALELSDGQAAQQAVMNIIAATDKKPSDWLDTLAYLYYNTGSYGNCIMASRKILNDNDQKLGILEIKAIAEKNIGLYKEALKSYETLQTAQPNINYLYEIATIQFQMKRYGECEVTINRILNDEAVDNEEVTIQAQKIRPQKVKMRAAVLNMLGVLAAEMNRMDEAAKFYQKALDVQKDFQLAAINLQVIKKAAEQANKQDDKPKGDK